MANLEKTHREELAAKEKEVKDKISKAVVKAPSIFLYWL